MQKYQNSHFIKAYLIFFSRTSETFVIRPEKIVFSEKARKIVLILPRQGHTDFLISTGEYTYDLLDCIHLEWTIFGFDPSLTKINITKINISC